MLAVYIMQHCYVFRAGGSSKSLLYFTCRMRRSIPYVFFLCWNIVAVELSFWIIAVIHSDLCGTSIQHQNSYIAWIGCRIQGVALFLLNESQVEDFIDKVIRLYWTFNCLHFQMYNFILWWWNNETPQPGKGCIWCCRQWKTFCWTKTTRDARC